MATVEATASRTVQASASEVFRLLTDPQRRRDLLPEAYHDVRVEPGEPPAVAYTLHAGGRERDYRMHIVPAEPDARVRDEDQLSSLRTEWVLTPSGGATEKSATSRVEAGKLDPSDPSIRLVGESTSR